LDSSILLGQLLREGHEVQPFYLRCGLHWEREELETARQYLRVVASPGLRPLVELEMPLDDLYGRHWSITGREAPDSSSPDEAVYLPSRNLLLIVKAALWCQMHGIESLALAVLGSNPFDDATSHFFNALETVLNCTPEGRIRLVRPFSGLEKPSVMETGREMPLEYTFSCIAPQRGLHCGHCNKCAERRAAFASIGLDDPTHYATPAAPSHAETGAISVCRSQIAGRGRPA
jgi:7-cyano-7-deazaguanine synthase